MPIGSSEKHTQYVQCFKKKILAILHYAISQCKPRIPAVILKIIKTTFYFSIISLWFSDLCSENMVRMALIL